MLSYEDIVELLALQAKAYELLMWLSEASVDNPEMLSADAAARLAHPSTAATWIAEHRSELPADLATVDPHGPFANLLASFFSTSFRVEHLEFRNRLVSARIVLYASPGPADRTGIVRTQALAVKHLATSQQLPTTEGQARGLIRARRDLRDAVGLWTYVWELDRRARNKGKGPVVHQIWRSIPWERRRALTADQVWSARQQLLDAAREHVGGGA
jgi:hypothetical protein